LYAQVLDGVGGLHENDLILAAKVDRISSSV
jgi:pterin-4a-carbinolamine dehydratase